MFQGSIVALLTPMKDDGSLDKLAFLRLIEMHIEAGTQALVLNGSTGESPTVYFDEQIILLKWALEITQGRLPIIAGTGTYSTAETIRRTQCAQALGVDACLVVAPYYNKPTQVGLLAHYKAITENVDIPIILYNVPARTQSDLFPETVAELSQIDNIIAIKEATGDIERLKQLQLLCQKDFLYFTGVDKIAFEFMCQGGHGNISITANIVPKITQAVAQQIQQKDFNSASKLNKKIELLNQAMSIESNPIPVKWALNRLGWIDAGIRLPLTWLPKDLQVQIEEALLICGVKDAYGQEVKLG